MAMKVIQGGNQMSLIRDTEEVIKFLEFVGRKSILNEQAVNVRLTACNNLFAVVNEEEDQIDYILKNLDVLTNRFHNKNTTVQPSTLKVYKSRVKSSIEDYKAWSADPFAWERSLTDKAKLQSEGSREKKQRVARPKKVVVENAVETVVEESSAAKPQGPFRKVSFPIRPDFSIEMSIPSDGLTTKELQRLGLFLYPYCQDIDPALSPWGNLFQNLNALQ